METINAAVIEWSRAQFALTAAYHWLFVPLTLGLGVVQAIMETIYYRTGDEFWKRTAKFWMKIFGINFAIGVASGLILEFEFGTNWSNYSWFVGDIFGAPLAIEGILAFFMEATFIAVMFFGWNKVSKRFHLASTWLTIVGATISAYWILVANAWMQNPVGMHFNPDTVRNEMLDFWAVALSPLAVNKFFHAVFSGWATGAIFVVGVAAWFLLKKREAKFAMASIKVAGLFGLVAILLSVWTGDGSAHQVAQKQPMKLAAMEGFYEGQHGAGLVGVGILNPSKQAYNDGVDPFLFKFELPKMLSFFAERDLDAYVPGIRNLMDGGYVTRCGDTALSAHEKVARGQAAIQALAGYREAKKANNDSLQAAHLDVLNRNFEYFGWGYIKHPTDAIPPVGLTFYAFRVMVILGGYLLLLFALAVLFGFKDQLTGKRWLRWKKTLVEKRWLLWVFLLSIPAATLAGQAGWVVAEVGRQPWTIQDILPTSAAISNLSVSSVQLTFFIFVALFAVLLAAEVKIMLSAIKKGPEIDELAASKAGNLNPQILK
ncbi:MAG: cytochrome ubiquinol oxidase subunit I [Prevotellaceae bacterium]|jgi:cytochrome d ubiquinol oxidase subunit I|nr:cytochrome ubiquinol oxidase subunit I [Prevotellaceae bacterium]